MSLPRPWPHRSATPARLAGTCDPRTVCTCLGTSNTARTKSYLLDRQCNTHARILTPDLGDHLESLGHVTMQPVVYYPFHSSSYPAVTTVSVTEGDELSSHLSIMYGETPSYADLAVSCFEMTPLQRFEAEPVSLQPYNTVSSFRLMSSGNNNLPQSQPSHNIAYNGSNIVEPDYLELWATRGR
jgi:hypothetical protein